MAHTPLLLLQTDSTTPHCCGCRQTPPHPTAALPFLFPPLHVMWGRSQVSDAIPIPGLLEGLAPSVQAARTASSSANSGGGGGVATVAAVPVALAAAAAAAAAPALVRLPQQDAELLSGAGLALEQVASVVNEARAGLRMICTTRRGVHDVHDAAGSGALQQSATAPRAATGACGSIATAAVKWAHARTLMPPDKTYTTCAPMHTHTGRWEMVQLTSVRVPRRAVHSLPLAMHALRRCCCALRTMGLMKHQRQRPYWHSG